MNNHRRVVKYCVNICVLAFFVLFMISTAMIVSYAADDTVKRPAARDNLGNNNIRSTYIESADGGYLRVFQDEGNIFIEYYDAGFEYMETKSLAMELPVWGGFYKGEDAYYIVEGQNNKECIDGTEVLRIIKYDTSWNRLGAGSILAQEGWEYEIRYPFDWSCVNMTETGGDLYVVTGRQGYVDERYGQGHQGMMLIRMDESSFETEIVYGDFWHSFAQYIASKGSDIYIYEQSEGSRATTLSHFDANSTGTDYFDAFDKSFSVFKYGGERTSAWSIPCYATVDDVALSDENVLGIGTSIDQSKYGKDDLPYNIYLTVTPISDLSLEATKVKWLTNKKSDDSYFEGVSLTKTGDDRFLVTWGQYDYDSEESPTDKMDPLSWNKLYYMFVDGAGNKLSEVFTAGAAFSDCHPVVCGNSAVFCASSYECVDFYSIDIQSGAFSKRVYQIRYIDDAEIKTIPDQIYSGQEIKPTVVVKYKNKKLTEGVDYSLSYKNNVNVGTATIKIKGKGEYNGSAKKKFKIVPAGTNIKKATPKKKAIYLKWKKQDKQTTGYEIQIGQKKNFKGAKKVIVKSSGTTSKKIRKLKAKKKYYVRIRAYKMVNGKKYYSAWSKKKTVKTK